MLKRKKMLSILLYIDRYYIQHHSNFEKISTLTFFVCLMMALLCNVQDLTSNLAYNTIPSPNSSWAR